ncbi:MAG TPA: hypothetical protein EYP14_13120, partial [Planctomycetaceae bacterium]|nr:hypothetical protein [Planctomycetaceae bacterium]
MCKERNSKDQQQKSPGQASATTLTDPDRPRRVARLLWLSLLAAIPLALLFLALGTAFWRLFRPPPSLSLIRLWTDYELWDRADKGLRRYLERWPDHDEALMLAARVAAAKGELQRCAHLLARVPNSSPLKCAALVRQGQALRQLGYGRLAER